MTKKTTPVEGAPVGTIDDFLDGYQPRTDFVRLSMRGDLAAQLAELQDEYTRAVDDDERHNRPPQAPKILDRIRDVRDEIEAARVPFVVRVVEGGSKGWSDLLAKHKPTGEQRKAGLDHNPETFWPEALAATIVLPAGITPEKVARLHATVPPGDWDLLVAAVWKLHKGGGAVPLLPNVSRALRLSDANSGTSPNGESPAA